jgi:hypothetical protein
VGDKAQGVNAKPDQGVDVTMVPTGTNVGGVKKPTDPAIEIGVTKNSMEQLAEKAQSAKPNVVVAHTPPLTRSQRHPPAGKGWSTAGGGLWFHDEKVLVRDVPW